MYLFIHVLLTYSVQYAIQTWQLSMLWRMTSSPFFSWVCFQYACFLNNSIWFGPILLDVYRWIYVMAACFEPSDRGKFY